MRTTPRRGALTALTVSTLLLATACTGSDSAPADPQGKDSGTSSPSPSAEPVSRPLSEQQVKESLLEVADLPKGWEVDKEVSGSEAGHAEFQMAKATKRACQPLLDAVVAADSAPLPERAEIAAFAQGDTGPMLVSGVTVFQEQEAEELAKDRTVAAQCRRFTADFQGDTVTFVHSPLSVPDVGDQSGGVRLKSPATDELSAMQFDMGWARIGGTIVNVTLISYDTSDSTSFQQALTRAAEKVEQASRKG